MKAKVLIVDDSSVSRMMIKGRIVVLQPDWEILEAGYGAQAVAMVESNAPDFITMDVNMPGMSGFDAVEKIRQIDQRAKIVILTANIQESTRNAAGQAGIGFVSKPITERSVTESLAFWEAAP